MKTASELRLRLGRVPLLALGIAALVTGVWGGLLRLPVAVPMPTEHANWITFHGPLMVCGFLGTVIGLERAIGLPGLWAYAAPILTGAGALALMTGQLGRPPVLLITTGSALFLLVSLRVVRMRTEAFTVIMSLGALTWVVGNALWLLEYPLPRAVPWWMLFLGLTIVGERLDLGRFQKPVPWAPPVLYAVLGIAGAGALLGLVHSAAGARLLGAGWLATALWLGRFDLARRTLRQPGLPRFMAICLLSGFGWLAVSGILLLGLAPTESGPRYDAALHTFFLGFVFAMIFGHAPVIFPAVLRVPTLAYRSRFLLHLGLLHAAVLLRTTGDLTGWETGRRWGAVGGAVALGVFLINTVSSLVAAVRPRSAKAKTVSGGQRH